MAGRACSKAVKRAKRSRTEVPADRSHVELSLGGREVRLTNLQKPFWTSLNITKGELL